MFGFANGLLLLLLAAAFAVRLGVALPGILEDPAARFSRPDTPGYLEPARALAAEGTPLSAGRAPGFPLFAALVFRCFGVEAYGALAVLLAGGSLLVFRKRHYEQGSGRHTAVNAGK